MSSRSNPLLSVIIPTRERAETLQYTLRTALDQSSQNFEVIVSDNFSQDNTAQVVSSFSDPRIRLINPGRRLSMSDHWDFALLHAAGDYVMFIGDDDAVLPGALDKLETSILTTDCLAYGWPRPIYVWPIDGKPARVEDLYRVRQTSEIDLEKLARVVVSMGGWNYSYIPSVYHSAVAKSILDSIRTQTGRVFHTTQPDVFTSMAVPAFAKTAIILGYYVSVHGRSEKANSGATGRPDRHEHLDRFIQECGDYNIHSTLFPHIPLILNLIPDALLVAMDRFPDFYGEMKFNYDAMWAVLLDLNSFVFKYKLSTLDIIRKRQQIRRYHPFDVSRFLLYSADLQALRLPWRMVRWVGATRGLATQTPDNISEFVKVLSRPNSIRRRLGGSKWFVS
jgi:glycosyltransferase involved in cell wall biosynthesis